VPKQDYYDDPGAPKANSIVVAVTSDPRHVIAHDNGEVRREFSVCFHAKPVGGELRSSSQSREARWISPELVGDLNIDRLCGSA
jgi:hypothetical protein